MQGSIANVEPSAPKPEDALEARAVHPARGARVPRPAPAPGMGGVRVDVTRDDVGLRLVALDVGRGPGVVDGVQHVEELHRLVAAAQPGHGHDHPEGRVRVLAAVLPDSGRIALDVTRILGRLVERRREEEHDLRPAPDEVGADGVERALREAEGNRAREHRPGLRDGVDPALVVLGRAQGRAVVVVAPPVPLAVPRLLEHAPEATLVAAVAVGAARVAAALAPGRRTRPGSRAGRSPATCSRPALHGPRGSCRRSSRRCP